MTAIALLSQLDHQHHLLIRTVEEWERIRKLLLSSVIVQAGEKNCLEEILLLDKKK